MPCLNGQCDAGLHCNANDVCEADVCLAWSPSGASGGTGVTGGTDTGADGTGGDGTGGGASCQAYGEAYAACFGSDPTALADSCQQAVDAAYTTSASCGETYEGYFNCLATSDCAALEDGSADTNCQASWDFATACQ
jgi:hypothetical protein